MALGYDGTIRIDTQVDTANAQKRISSLGTTLKSMGKVLLSVFAVSKIIDFGKSAVQVASNLEEVQNVVDVAFGDMADKANAFAKNALNSFGLSELSAKKYSSQFMTMSKSMGLASEAAAEMAFNVTGLVGDVSSFYNISQDLAAVKLKGIWTGETEALKDLGVVMTVANLEAFALEKGITKSLDSMTQSEKVILRYQYVTEQLALSQGDFVRTQDSWANQTRILSERFKEFQSILGTFLINYLTPVVKMLNTAVGYMISFGRSLQSLTGIGSSTDSLTESTENAVEAEKDLAEAIEETENAIDGSLASFDKLNVLSDTISDEEDSLSSLFGDVDAGNIEIGGNAEVSPEIENVVNELLPMLTSAKEYLQKLGEMYKKVYNEYLKPFIISLAEEAFPLIKNLANEILDLYNTILPIANFLLDYLKPAFSLVFDFAIIEVKRMINIVRLFVNTIKNLLEFIVNVFSGDWKGAWENIKNIFKGLWDYCSGYAKDIFGAIKNNFDKFFGDFKEAWLDGWNIIGDFFAGIWNKIVESAKNSWDKIKEFFTSGINGFLSLIEGFVNLSIRAINLLIKGLNKISVSLPDWDILGDLKGKKFGVNIPLIDKISIPKLANGAVIQPNQEFLAVLGDQKSGVNIETPLDTMIQAFKIAMQQTSFNGNSEQTVVLNIDGYKLATFMLPKIKKAEKIKGTNLIIGG